MNWVSGLYQDDLGYLWIGTQYGLNRFDGKSLTSFTYHPDQPHGLRANWVKCITQDSAGKLRIGTYGGGISLYNPLDNTFSEDSIATLLEKREVHQILYMPDASIWYGCIDGLFRQKDGVLKQVLTGRRVRAMSKTSEIIWVGSDEGLHGISPVNLQTFSLETQKKVVAIHALDSDSLLYVGDQELFLMVRQQDQTWKEIPMGISINVHKSNFYTPVIFQDRKHNIWISAKEGLIELDPSFQIKQILSLEQLFGVQLSKVISLHAMLEDHEGSFWLGTNQGLFQLFQVKPFLNSPVYAQGNPLKKTRSICSNEAGYVFATPQGLYEWTKPDSVLRRISTDLCITTLRDKKGAILGVSQNTSGLYVWRWKENGHTLQEISSPILQAESFGWWKMAQDRNERIWIAVKDRLICQGLTGGESFELEIPLTPQFQAGMLIVDVLVDSRDRLWLGTLKGLICIEHISEQTHQSEVQLSYFMHDPQNLNSLSSNLIQCLYETRDGNIWIGTDGGLNCYDPQQNQFKRWVRDASMVDDKILEMVEDSSGILWLSTISHGILSFDPRRESFIHYMEKDGVLGNSMLLGSMYQDPQGRIWVGSEKGLNTFYPSEVRKSQKFTPKFTWQELTRNQAQEASSISFPQVGTQAQPLLMGPKDQSLILDFGLLSFKDPSQTRFHFIVEGYHSTWLPPNSEGKLILTQISPGSYRILAEAYSLDSTFHVIHPPIYLAVYPPWYRSTWAYLLYIGILGAAAYFLFTIQLKRRIAEEERKSIQDLIDTKTEWFYQIAHEFRNPLTLMFSAIGKLKNAPESYAGMAGNPLEDLEKQASHLTQQIEGILALAKAQEGNPMLDVKEGDFISLQQFLLASFQSKAEEKAISLHFDTQLSQLIFPYDEEAWRKITTNLISNALKFCPAGAEVWLSVEQVEKEGQQFLRFSVRDSGPGIAQTLLPSLFQPFSQAREHRFQGSGIGLALVKTLVEIQGGSIRIESEEGKGSSFIIEQILPETVIYTTPNPIELYPLPYMDGFSTILIADDNPEIRNFLRECLATQFQLLEAVNGLEAWDLCQTHLPDLVVSDVVMPGLSGFEFGEKMKKDPRTDHIPLVLLTGRSEQAARMEGLKVGAIEYLPKPFNSQELLLRVDQILSFQKRLQHKYQQGQTIGLRKSPADAFMHKVIDAIEKNMAREEFGVKELADVLHLSRGHLFKKVKNLTGKSPTFYIRHIRLLKAQKLLNQTDATIAEISYKVGFKDPSYFSRVFAETFGQSPSDTRG